MCFFHSLQKATAKPLAKCTIKYSKITEGRRGFSHLNKFFIPHIEMASHFSASPQTAGIYNSIKAHESINQTSYTVAVYTSKPLVYFFEQYHQNQYIPHLPLFPKLLSHITYSNSCKQINKLLWTFVFFPPEF